MQIGGNDKQTLRELAERYSAIAHLDVQQQRMERYRKTNAMDEVRPVVLIDEVPWGEIRDEALENRAAPEWGWLETHLRRTLYQWAHFQVDLVVPPVFRVGKRIRWRSGIGLEVQDRQIKGDTGAYISAHAYQDQLQTEDDLAKLQEPELVYDQAASEQARAVAADVFAGLMNVELVGGGMGIQHLGSDRDVPRRGEPAHGFGRSFGFYASDRPAFHADRPVRVQAVCEPGTA